MATRLSEKHHQPSPMMVNYISLQQRLAILAVRRLSCHPRLKISQMDCRTLKPDNADGGYRFIQEQERFAQWIGNDFKLEGRGCSPALETWRVTTALLNSAMVPIRWLQSTRRVQHSTMMLWGKWWVSTYRLYPVEVMAQHRQNDLCSNPSHWHDVGRCGRSKIWELCNDSHCDAPDSYSVRSVKDDLAV